MLINNHLVRTIEELIIGLYNIIHVSLQSSQCLALLKRSVNEILLYLSNGIHVSLVAIGALSNLIAKLEDIAIDVIEVFHVSCIENLRKHLVVLLKQSGLSNNVGIEITQFIQIVILHGVVLLCGTKLELCHLECIAAIVRAGNHNLIILVRFTYTLRESEGNGVEVLSRQTVLTNILAVVNQYPTLSISCCLSVRIEVSAIDLPVPPVTARIIMGIVTCCQLVEQRYSSLHAAEDDIASTNLKSTTPLGLKVLVNQIANGTVTPGTTCSTNQDEAAFESCLGNLLDVADLSCDASIVE